MTSIKLSPSILAADFTRLGEEIGSVLAAGAEYIHVDVMDGRFVPNISIGVPVVKSIRQAFPEAFLDVHLMIVEPVRYVDAFCKAGASHLTLHVEADTPENITAALERTAAHGVRTGLSVKPGTPAAALEPWLDGLDMALVMTVEPGFGGQPFMADKLDTIRKVRQVMDRYHPECDVEVDGGIVPETAKLVAEAGANVLVAGSAVYSASDPAAAIAALRAAGQ